MSRKPPYESIRTFAKLLFVEEYDRWDRHKDDPNWRRPNSTDLMWNGLPSVLRKSYMDTARLMLAAP